MGNGPSREQMVEYVRRWRKLGPLLEEIRDEEVRRANTQEAILMMDQAFKIALRDLPPRETSGLVEWQRWMEVWRQRG